MSGRSRVRTGASHTPLSSHEVAMGGAGVGTNPGLLLHWPCLGVGVGGASQLGLLSVYICKEDVNTS